MCQKFVLLSLKKISVKGSNYFFEEVYVISFMNENEKRKNIFLKFFILSTDEVAYVVIVHF